MRNYCCDQNFEHPPIFLPVCADPHVHSLWDAGTAQEGRLLCPESGIGPKYFPSVSCSHHLSGSKRRQGPAIAPLAMSRKRRKPLWHHPFSRREVSIPICIAEG